MDRTSVVMGSETRDSLREFKKSNDLPNYDAAVRALLGEQED